MANSMAVIPDNEIIVEGGGLVPSTQGASSGDVLTVGQNGPEWAAPGGGGGSGSEVLACDLQLTWNSTYNYASYTIPTDIREKITPGTYAFSCYVQYGLTRPLPEDLQSLSTPLNIHGGIWAPSSGYEAALVVLPKSNVDNTLRTFEMSGMFIIDDSSFAPVRYQVSASTQMNATVTEPPYRVKIWLTKL